MSSNHSKTPPSLSKAKNYQVWLKHIKIWRNFTDLPAAKQGPAIVLSLENKASYAVLELREEVISLKHLKTLENFETFKRPENMKMSDYLNKFEQLYKKIKSYGTQMSENVLAYRLLKYANLPELHEQMVKETITNLKFDLMKDQLKKMFRESLSSIEKCPIKREIPSILNMLVETIMTSCMKVTSVMMKNANNKKHTLQVIPNDI